MLYKIDNGIWANIFAVPTEIVDKHIKLSSELALRAILILLRNKEGLTAEQLAEMFENQNPKPTIQDAQDAINYWVSHGIICRIEEEITKIPFEPVLKIEEIIDNNTKTIEKQQVGNVTTMSVSRMKLSSPEIAEMAESDKNIGELLAETEILMGATLTPVIRETIVSLYTYYGMKPDLILMLLQYCLSIGQKNMRYLEKMASVWLEKGINTHEKAESEIVRYTKQNSTETKIKNIMGIHDRELVKNEKNYVDTWLNKLAMDIPLIEIAYERTIELKGKLNFAYINGILTNWHKSGVDTPAKALKSISVGKNDKKSSNSKMKDEKTSYDMQELENMITFSEIGS